MHSMLSIDLINVITSKGTIINSSLTHHKTTNTHTQSSHLLILETHYNVDHKSDENIEDRSNSRLSAVKKIPKAKRDKRVDINIYAFTHTHTSLLKFECYAINFGLST